jgi:MFS family permease
VAGSIVGRGMGPVLGALLYYVDFQWLGYNMNGMNFPSLIMGIVWLVYSVMVLVFFKEPEIRKLSKDTLKQSEGQSLLPMSVTLMALFVPKVVHEAFVTSTPIVAPLYFGWSIEFVGYYIAIMSMAIAPVHIIIAYTSRRFQDRQFIEIALLLTFLGSLLLINFTHFTEMQYIIGTILMFIGMNMDDGVTASLLSKVIPPHISEGIFNAGLIVTFAGSFARGVGGFGIAIAGWIDKDPNPMENILFIPLTIISLASLLIFMKYYNRLDTKLFTK